MRSRIALLSLVGLCVSAVAVAQRRPPTTAPANTAATTASADAGAATAASADASAAPASADGGATEGPATNNFDVPMANRGTGALTHFPIPEQLARNDVPVFAQVRTSAPLDHVSLFYRTPGGRVFREVRMNAMGQEQRLTGGYGAHIPCDDAFPPAVEYYVQAVDTSGHPVGSAGSTTDPIRLTIVPQRTRAFIPTLPGQPAPRNCGTLQVAVSTTRDGGTGDGGSGAGEEFGTADLGEPCTTTRDCRRGLRCGSNRQCVFINPPR